MIYQLATDNGVEPSELASATLLVLSRRNVTKSEAAIIAIGQIKSDKLGSNNHTTRFK
jgi:hypothetical protein